MASHEEEQNVSHQVQDNVSSSDDAIYLSKDERIKKAYHAVQGGTSLHKAAKGFGVAKTTLHRRLQGGSEDPKKRGRKPWLLTDDEKDLENWALQMTKIGCALTEKPCKTVVKNILDKKKINVFPPDNLPSQNWVDRFLARHPNLTSRV